MASDAMVKATALLATPDAFRTTALSFPDKVDQALMLIETPEAAKEMMDQAAMLEHYARRVKADTEITNAISYGKLKIIARLGELLAPETPAESGARGGRGNKGSQPDCDPFSPPTLVKYRKVAKHQDRLPEYYRSAQEPENGKPQKEVTIDGFVRFATGKEHPHVSENTGLPEWYTPEEYLEAARSVMGGIDLDPATSEIAQANVRATTYFTAEDDGLARPWERQRPHLPTGSRPEALDFKLSENVVIPRFYGGADDNLRIPYRASAWRILGGPWLPISDLPSEWGLDWWWRDET